jgi:hypothetical protein
MLIKREYKANKFFENLDILRSTFEIYSKFAALAYTQHDIYLMHKKARTPYYIKFYINRILKLISSLEKLFNENDIVLATINDNYILEISFQETLKIEQIRLKVPGIIEDIKIEKGLNTFQKKQFYKDTSLINYLISLEDMTAEVDKLTWEEWIIKYTTPEILMEFKSSEAKFEDTCFSNTNSTIDHILESEITALEKQAFELKNKKVSDFSSLFKSLPRTLSGIEKGSVLERQEEQSRLNLIALNAIKDKKQMKFSDKLRSLAEKVDGSDESIRIVLQSLTVENFTGLLEELLKCIPGVLTFEEFIYSVLDGSFEMLTLDFFNDMISFLPPQLQSCIFNTREAKFPWETDSSMLDLMWFEGLIKNLDLALGEEGYPKFINLQKLRQANNYPSVMYHIIKMHFGDEVINIDFKVIRPELGRSLEEYAVLNFGRATLTLNLKFGQNNKDVIQLQNILNSLGYKDDKEAPLKEDGKFGKLTKQAVKNFQRNNLDSSGAELKVDGEVGPKTYSALQPIEEFKNVFYLDKSKLEYFLLELVSLSGQVSELSALQIPSFSNFVFPNVSVPNFQNKILTGSHYKQMYDYVSVFFPKYNFTEGDKKEFFEEQELSAPGKKSFYKMLYQTLLSEELLIGKIPKTLVDTIFTNTESMRESMDAGLKSKESNEYYSKLFLSIFMKNITALENCPDLNLPDLNLPSLGSPDLNLPSLGSPDLNLPDLNLPDLNLPDLNLPDLNLPDLNLPDLNLPDLGFSDLDYQQILYENLLKIPELDYLFDTFSPEFSPFPSIDNFKLAKLELPKFKLPNIPKLPSIKFNLIEFISVRLIIFLKKTIIKIFLSLLARSIDLLTNEICADPNAGGIQAQQPDGGLNTLVGDIVCPDKEPKEASEELMKKTLKSTRGPEFNKESVTKLTTALSTCALTSEIAPAILGNKEKTSPMFLNKMANVVNATAPEFSDVLGTPELLSEFLEKAGNLLSPPQRENLQVFVDTSPNLDLPVNPTICMNKAELQQWSEERQELFTNQGFDPVMAEHFIERQRQRASDNLSDIIKDIINSPEEAFAQSIDEALADEECNELLNPPEIQNTVQKISDDLLSSLNTTLIEDMLEDKFFSFSGTISKMLSDKFGRSMSEITMIKSNFFMNLLVNLNIIPPPTYAETIFKDLTDKINNITYNSDTRVLNTPAVIEKNVFRLPILNKIKQTIKSYQYTNPNIVLSYDNNSVSKLEYMEYLHEEKNTNGIKIGTDIIKPSREARTEIRSRYAEYGFTAKTTPEQIMDFLMGGNYQEQYLELNDLLINYMKKTFGVDTPSGFPVEIKGDDIAFSGGDNTTKTLAQLDNPGLDSRVVLLDPEIYGGSYERPKIFIKPPDPEQKTGFYAYSKKLFAQDEDKKINKTILNLESVSQYINEIKKKIDDTKFRKAEGIEKVIEAPFTNTISKQKVSQVWGHIKILIRVYLAEFFTTAYPVIEKLGVVANNYGELLPAYITHRIEKDFDQMKKIGSDVSLYTPYVTYIMILEQIAIEHMATSTDTDSSSFNQIVDNYTALSSEDIEYLKSKTHNSNMLIVIEPKYSNFVKGYAVLSFGSNWENVLNSLSGFRMSLYNFDEKELRLASKIGGIVSNKNRIENILKKKVTQELQSYSETFSAEISNINLAFLESPEGMDTSISSAAYSVNENGYYLKKYLKITEKDNTEIEMDYEELLQYLSRFDQNTNISDVLGNAEVDSLYDQTYKGTIGIKFGLLFGYKEATISSYEKDVRDYTISEVLTAGENLGEDVECHMQELFKTDRMNLFFDHSLHVSKIGSLIAIHFMRNSLSSVRQYSDEIAVQFNPMGALEKAIDLLPFPFPTPLSLYQDTKKEVATRILDFIRREISDPKDTPDSFSDFKGNKTIESNFDSKNLKIDGLNQVPFYKKFLITNNIPLDKDGNPLVSKFLSTLFEEE